MSSGIMQRTNIPNSDLPDAVSPNSAVNLVWLAPFLLALAWFWANISAVKWLLSSFVEIPTLYKIVIGFLIVALVVRSIGNSRSPARIFAKFRFEAISAAVDVGCGYLLDRPSVHN
jgi:hypothetical protein